MRILTTVVLATAMLGAAAGANAAITWTDWTAASATSATGTIGSVTVTQSGDLHNWQIAGGTDYWRIAGVTPFAAYDGVSNLPTNNDFIAPSTNGQVHTFSFSAPVTNPYLAIISLGRTNVNTQWTFDQPWSFVDQGTGFFGSGALVKTGNVLSAGEGHGIIQFAGTFSTLTLRTDDVEFWSGLTFGTEVPEPQSWAMFIAGFGMVGFAMRRRRTAVAA